MWSVLKHVHLKKNKSVRVEHTHDRSGQPDKHTVAVQDDPEVYHEATMLNNDNETIREIIEGDIDFKIPELPHSNVKQVQSANVWKLIQKIENHPNRHALQRDLQQSQSFNPFSPESKQMIHEVGTIDLCELLETEPKTQCKVCLSYWDIGIVYCTCGHFLRKGSQENQKFVKYAMDLLSIPDYYIKKGRPHGHRYGKKPGNKEYYVSNFLKRRKCKKRDFQGIHDRFIRDEQFRSRMIQIGRTEENCRQMDDLANEDHTHHLTPQEYDHYKSNWWLRSNKIGSDTMPIRHRSDFKQALSTLPQLKEKTRCSSTKPTMGTKFFFLVELARIMVDSLFLQTSPWRRTKYWLIREPDKQVSGALLQGMIFLNSFALLQLDRLQLTAVYCNRRCV